MVILSVDTDKYDLLTRRHILTFKDNRWVESISFNIPYIQLDAIKGIFIVYGNIFWHLINNIQNKNAFLEIAGHNEKKTYYLIPKKMTSVIDHYMKLINWMFNYSKSIKRLSLAIELRNYLITSLERFQFMKLIEQKEWDKIITLINIFLVVEEL